MTHWPQSKLDEVLTKQHLQITQQSIDANDTPDPGPESDLLSKCLNYCKERGYPAWHDRSRKKNQPGWPDLIIFLPGSHVILIELKSAKGVFRDQQQALARQFMYLKHRFFKVRSYTKFLEIMAKELST